MPRSGSEPSHPVPEDRSGDEASSSLESTASLLARVRRDDPEALDRLVRRYLPALKRWARGRLPGYARDLADTDDLVQITLLRSLDRVKQFEPRRQGAFLAYLRRVLVNQIRDQIRRVGRRPAAEPLTDAVPEDGLSPLEVAIGREALEAYEAALARIPDRQREAVLMRIEFGFSYQEIAEALPCPSANAARMLVSRGLVRLSEEIDEA